MAEAKSATNPQQQQTGKRDETSRAIEPRRSSTEVSRAGMGSSPFSFMRRFMSDMDRLFGEFGMGSGLSSSLSPYGQSGGWVSAWSPQVDIFERNGQLVVHADLPGLRSEDVRVNVEDDALTISGERRHEHEHKEGGVYQCERSYGSFERTVPLPQGVNPDSVQASFENGVLEVTMPMPKGQSQRGKTIPIGAKAPQGTGGVQH